MTIKNEQTTRLQVWPSGKSYTFIGDPMRDDDPIYVQEDHGELFRMATPEEAREIHIETLANIYQSRDVHQCMTGLVDELLKLDGGVEGFTFDDIKNLYKDTSEWTVEQCRDYITDIDDDSDIDADFKPWQMSREKCVELLESVSIDCADDETIETLREAVLVNINDETLEGLKEWREKAREIAADNPAEVLEWWLVSEWLANQLDAIGEPVLMVGHTYGNYWGRTCSGQSFLMDGTLQEVAATFVKEGA